MDYTHLTNEEINYELALRHVVNLGPTTHRGKVLRLKALIQEESLRDNIPSSSEHVMSAQADIEVCQSQVGQLHLLTETAVNTRDTNGLKQLRSRLAHYQNRLRLINPPVELQDTHTMVTMHVNVLFNKVVNVLRYSVNGGQESDMTGNQQENQQPNATGAIRRTVERDQGAIGGSNMSANSMEHAQEQEETPPSMSSMPRLLSFSGGRGQGLLLSNSQAERHSNRSEQRLSPEHRQGSPPPPYDVHEYEVRRTRAREAEARESRAREADEREARAREARIREAQAREEYHRIRDDLLDRLLRQERPPPARRDDERRMLKAVHNWPFKFRGEKDTTSLNVFLDRVETFARSEGMTDETLLSSVKHLLQEDALDWYARATSQRLLRSWDAFKREIRREFLPSGYSQILRLEASFRFQGSNESFAKFYRDISALFRFVEPPIPEEDKFFLVKKNMNENYAAIVTAARPRTLEEMVEICTGYDETRMLLSRQRRIPIPHSALLEPNFATPVTTTRPAPIQQQQPHRFNRVHAVEVNADIEEEASANPDEDDWQYRIDELVEQVNALKMNFERKNSIPNEVGQNQRQPRFLGRPSRTGSDNPQQLRQQQSSMPPMPVQQQQRSQNTPQPMPRTQQQVDQQQSAQGWYTQHWNQQQTGEQAMQTRRRSDPQQLDRPPRADFHHDQQQSASNQQRLVMICWNCDEEGHRFMDCPKPQAVLFCYRCGRKGYSLRSCFTCRSEAVNYTAGNAQ